VSFIKRDERERDKDLPWIPEKEHGNWIYFQGIFYTHNPYNHWKFNKIFIFFTSSIKYAK